MRQHVFAFLVALAVWMVGNAAVRALGQEGSTCIQLASVSPSHHSKVIITEDAYCVQSNYCWAWYLYTCHGHLPNCNGGCWITGYFPCSACNEQTGATCVQERITINAGLYRSDCTSSNGYNCNTCLGNYRYVGPYSVTSFQCRS